MAIGMNDRKEREIQLCPATAVDNGLAARNETNK